MNLKKSKIFIHVGLQKTGTTFLQEKIFKQLDVNYIRYLDREIYYSQLDASKPILISNEDLCGTPHAIYNRDASNNRYHIAKNLHRLFPNAKIIVGLRDPESWLKSIYRESVRQGLPLSFNAFKSGFNEDMLDFDNYTEFLMHLFKDVYIYYYEDFKENNWAIIHEICKFIGVSSPSCFYGNRLVNKSLEDWQIPGFRFLNMFLHSKNYNPKGIIPHKYFSYLYNFIREDGIQ